MSTLSDAAKKYADELIESASFSFDRDSQKELMRALLGLAYLEGALHGVEQLREKLYGGKK